MAELADIRLALANIISAAVYPNGTGAASVISGLTGKCAVYQNDPKPEDIDTRLLSGDVLIAVVDTAAGRSTARYFFYETVTTPPAPTLAWTVSGNTATLTGTVSVPQNLAIQAGASWVSYAVQSADTLDSIAASVAALIPGATVSGATITLPAAYIAQARVAAAGTSSREVGRQVTHFRVSIWAGTEALRSAATNVVRGALEGLTRFTLPDGTFAAIEPGYELPVYDPLKLGVSRTNINYPVEFATVTQQQVMQIMLIETDLSISIGDADVADITITS
jgi:hypothetical protein